MTGIKEFNNAVTQKINIKGLLEETKLSVSQLAKSVGVNPRSIYRYRDNFLTPRKSVKILLTIINNGYDIEELVKNPRKK